MSNIGRVLYDSWRPTVRIEAEGYDWIVTREINDVDAPPRFEDFTNASAKQEEIERCAMKPED